MGIRTNQRWHSGQFLPYRGGVRRDTWVDSSVFGGVGVGGRGLRATTTTSH
jgi:hypothetical protein